MLEEVAAAAPVGAVRLVAREDLGAALAATPRITGAPPRPSLLPDTFHRDAVVARLTGLIDPGRDGGSGTPAPRLDA
jgi:hypothetical protein